MREIFSPRSEHLSVKRDEQKETKQIVHNKSKRKDGNAKLMWLYHLYFVSIYDEIRPDSDLSFAFLFLN